jgi:hypothetical protein
LLEIFNAEKPSVTYGRRKHLATSIRFFGRTLAMIGRVYSLFTAGGPLFLQLPPVYGWDDDFIQTTSPLERTYISRDQRRPHRLWSAEVRTVDRPMGDQQGATCTTWCAVNDAFATYADLTAAAGDWGDVAEGTVQC